MPVKVVARQLQDGERFGTAPKSEVCIQRERRFIVKRGVDHRGHRAPALHPAHRIGDESASNSPTTELRIHREPLEVTEDSRLTGQRESADVWTAVDVVHSDNPCSMAWGGVRDVVERPDVVAPRVAERAAVERSDVWQVRGTEPLCFGPLTARGASRRGSQRCLEQGKGVDRPKANFGERGGCCGERYLRGKATGIDDS